MKSQHPLIFATLGLTVLLLASSVLGWQDGINILSSQSVYFNAVRVGILAVLVGVMLVKVPRHITLRVLLSVIGAALLIATIVLTASYQIGVLDGLLFMIVSVICFVEALEVNVRKIPVSFYRTRPYLVDVK